MSLQSGWIMEKIQRLFGAGIGMWLRRAVAEEGYTRGSLARGLCKFVDWRNTKGDLCLASARRALPALPLGFLPGFRRKFFRRRFGQPSETSTDHGRGEMQDPAAQNKGEQAADFCLIHHQ